MPVYSQELSDKTDIDFAPVKAALERYFGWQFVVHPYGVFKEDERAFVNGEHVVHIERELCYNLAYEADSDYFPTHKFVRVPERKTKDGKYKKDTLYIVYIKHLGTVLVSHTRIFAPRLKAYAEALVAFERGKGPHPGEEPWVNFQASNNYKQEKWLRLYKKDVDIYRLTETGLKPIKIQHGYLEGLKNG